MTELSEETEYVSLENWGIKVAKQDFDNYMINMCLDGTVTGNKISLIKTLENYNENTATESRYEQEDRIAKQELQDGTALASAMLAFIAEQEA